MAGWWTKLLGEKGERLAARYLRREGFKILARQYRNRIGEIDLIAKDGRTIVFVEVKSRSSTARGNPVEQVTFQKQKKLTDVAMAFLKRHSLLDHPARFDIVTVLDSPDSKRPEITHYRNAFSPVGFGQMYS